MSYMVVFKIGLCGFTFSWLLTEKFHTNDLSVLFFSTFYAMSGFVAAYNWNVMWMDTLVLAPLIVLGLEKLVFEKKYSLYCITLGLCILSNYYLSIMVCIFLCLYFSCSCRTCLALMAGKRSAQGCLAQSDVLLYFPCWLAVSRRAADPGNRCPACD